MESMSIADRINAFMQARDHREDTKTWNLLNTSFGGWLRYWTFLTVIRDRYVDASEAHTRAWRVLHESIEKGSRADERRPLTPDQREEYDRIARQSVRVHLEIESFYVFANILLDRIASTFRFYFWRRSNWNHRQLSQNLEKICVSKSLHVSSRDFFKMPDKLEGLIVKYRNTRIEHVEEPRLILGTSWSPSSRVKIVPMVLYPSADEAEEVQHSTADLDELLEVLGAYMAIMLDLFDANAAKSILPPQ